MQSIGQTRTQVAVVAIRLETTDASIPSSPQRSLVICWLKSNVGNWMMETTNVLSPNNTELLKTLWNLYTNNKLFSFYPSFLKIWLNAWETPL
jgi:hypothetical protein